jgi:alpha 1,6-mannosyltransferase
MQIIQWTMASAPYHPITLNALLRILHSTGKAVDWSHTHARDIQALKSLGRYKDMKALRETTVLDVPKMGGPVGIMAWTGPGVWTDAVLR